jgi:hypothetical protein
MKLSVKPLKLMGDQTDKKPPAVMSGTLNKHQSYLGTIKMPEMIPSSLESSNIIKLPKITSGVSSLSNSLGNKQPA